MAAVQFILGRSGTGKSRWCIDAVCDALADGGGEPLILLVPEQATYQVERSILSAPRYIPNRQTDDPAQTAAGTGR
jgi:ATP-dependent helicase/nuclease subunit B